MDDCSKEKDGFIAGFIYGQNNKHGWFSGIENGYDEFVDAGMVLGRKYKRENITIDPTQAWDEYQRTCAQK